MTCEEKDPPIQELVDVNEKSETHNECFISNYKFLRQIKLNTNALTKIDEVKQMEFLLELQAKTNQIASIAFLGESPDILKYLQKVDLSQNKITEVPQIQCPSLFSLNLEENEIAKITLNEHTRLKTLTLNKNKLTSCEGMTKLHRLETLSIAENELQTLHGLEELPVLTTLNVSGNKIEKLDPVP